MAKATFVFQPSSRLAFFTSLYSSHSVFIFISTIVLLLNCPLSNGSTSLNSDINISPNRRVGRQLGLGGGGFGGFGTSVLASLQPQPYNRRQQSAEANFFHSMMNLNFDMTEIFAMYRNVTAVAETPGCLGHCRTPMALWVVQSFYPCYNLKKADCPRGLVCCMSDPSNRIASPNSIHDSRIKGSPSLASAIRDRGQGQMYPYALSSNEDSSALPSSSAQSSRVKPTPNGPTQSTTLFDEEYFKNNFIQDEIPE